MASSHNLHSNPQGTQHFRLISTFLTILHICSYARFFLSVSHMPGSSSCEKLYMLFSVRGRLYPVSCGAVPSLDRSQFRWLSAENLFLIFSQTLPSIWVDSLLACTACCGHFPFLIPSYNVFPSPPGTWVSVVHPALAMVRHNEVSHTLVWCVEMAGMREGRALKSWFNSGRCSGSGRWMAKLKTKTLQKPFNVSAMSALHS